MIPQCDPKQVFDAHRAAISVAIERVLTSGVYIQGVEVESFEHEFSAFIGVPHGVGVANGTDAISVALRALDVGPGDYVLTPSHTAVATTVGIRQIGAVPVFVDINPLTYQCDASDYQRALDALGGDRTSVKAMVVVHLYGSSTDVTMLARFASENDLRLVEDCAQCHGASWMGQRLGSFGDASTFSFYPTKNLSTIGDGGAVLCKSEAVAARLRLEREYGWSERYISAIEARNSRLDPIHAAILRTLLPYLDRHNELRRNIAERYNAIRSANPPRIMSGCTPVYHQFVLQTPFRDQLKNYLKDNGIGTAIHYPVPIHCQPAYRSYSQSGPLTVTESTAKTILSLPISPYLRDDDIKTIVTSVNNFDAN